jgi:glycine betaine/choline ABC-type transport system substrate-binding protein
VVNEERLKSVGGEKYMSVVNAVNRELSQSAMIGMNGQVDLEKRNPADVARQFLQQRGLVRTG